MRGRKICLQFVARFYTTPTLVCVGACALVLHTAAFGSDRVVAVAVVLLSVPAEEGDVVEDELCPPEGGMRRFPLSRDDEEDDDEEEFLLDISATAAEARALTTTSREAPFCRDLTSRKEGDKIIYTV